MTRRILRYLRPYRGRFALAVGIAFAEAVLATIPLLALKILIDRLTENGTEFGDILLPVALAIGAAALAALVGVASTYLVQTIGEGIVHDLREELFGRLLGHGTAFYTRSRGGDILSRILSDVAGVESVLSQTLITAVRAGLTGAATLVLMFVLDWRLTLVCLALLPIVLLSTRRAGRNISGARRQVQEQLSDMTAYLQETLGLSGIQLVRAYGRQRSERERFEALNAELRRREIALAMTARWFTAGLGVITLVAPALIFLAGGYLVIEGKASIGTVLVFATLIAARLATSAQQLASSAASSIGSKPLWQRIFHTLDAPPEITEKPGATRLERVRGAVAFEGVTFAYPGQPRPAVEDISFEAEPGQLVALVGPSGAGKTTVSALVARLQDPQHGCVRLDGHDVRDLTLETLSDAIGLVFQDTFLFHATLGENLRYGRPDATDEEVAAAVADAHLDGVIAGLPDGYDTIVGERGHRLSGGEKQRVALARTMLRDPRVLVLDEATSHLDSASEHLVQDALRRVMVGRTSLVIAHRLSTIMRADLVLVLDRGRIVERGTHEQLLARDGLYAQLHGLQTA